MAADSRGPQIAAIAYTFVVISSIATCLRVYCRGWVSKAFGPDDYLAVIAQVHTYFFFVDGVFFYRLC